MLGEQQRLAEFEALKKNGDEFFDKQDYEKALEYYNKALELDERNLELLANRAYVYFRQRKYSDCISESNEIIKLGEGRRHYAGPVFTALFLIGCAEHNANGIESRQSVETALRQAFFIAPSNRIEQLISIYNKITKGGLDYSAALEVTNEGIMFYSHGDRQSAIQMFTEAIELNAGEALAFACRAICHAEDAELEDNLIRDIKQCLELDYRYLPYFLEVSERLVVAGQIADGFRLIEALSLSMESYKLCIGRMFPKLADGKPLDELEWQRFFDFGFSWFRNYFIKFSKLMETIYSHFGPTCTRRSTTDESTISDSASPHKFVGDQCYKLGEFGCALRLYSRALEKDESNLGLLLCRAQVYYDLKRYPKCIEEAEKLVALSNSQEGKSESLQVIQALKLIALSQAKKRNQVSALEMFAQAMQIKAPVEEIEFLIKAYNECKKCDDENSDLPASAAQLEAGIILYRRGNRRGAIGKFNNAIELNGANALAYACRAVCHAEDPSETMELSTINDVKECIELDYRFIKFFKNKATDELIRSSGIAACFRLYRGLSLSEAALKLSIGRIFPTLLDDKPLNSFEWKCYQDLEESWRENIEPTLNRLTRIEEVDLNIAL